MFQSSLPWFTCRRLSASYLTGLLAFAMGAFLQAQSLITDAAFFNPDFEARRPGSSSLLSLTVDTTLFTPASQSQGNISWTHSAGGLVQVGASVALVGTVDVQLAAYTRTFADSLIFGRELEVTTTGLLGGLGATVTSLTQQAVGASAINSWESSATATGLSLSQGQAYRVSFDVQAGAGIHLNALSEADFSLFSGALPIQNIASQQTLDVLGLLQLGGGLASIEFDFVASASWSELTFAFDAATIADVNLLGSISGNQTVLEFSNFSLAPVPEPSALVLVLAGVAVGFRRRRSGLV